MLREHFLPVGQKLKDNTHHLEREEERYLAEKRRRVQTEDEDEGGGIQEVCTHDYMCATLYDAEVPEQNAFPF